MRTTRYDKINCYNPDFLLYAGLADALTAHARHNPLELQKLQVYTNSLTTLVPTPSLRYTATTQIMLAATEALLSTSLSEIDEVHFSRAFVHRFKTDPRPGYTTLHRTRVLEPAALGSTTLVSGQLFLRWCERMNDNYEAALRSIPIGALSSLSDVVRIATLQAMITHNSSEGIATAQLTALMSHFALYEDKPLSNLPHYLTQKIRAYHIKELFPLNESWTGSVGDKDSKKHQGISATWSALTLLKNSTDLSSILETLFEWGGDINPTATIAWSIASHRYPNDVLARRTLEHFEGGDYGKSYLANLGIALRQKKLH